MMHISFNAVIFPVLHKNTYANVLKMNLNQANTYLTYPSELCPLFPFHPLVFALQGESININAFIVNFKTLTNS